MNRFLLQTYPNTPSRIPGSIPPKDNEHLKVRIDLLYDGKELIRPHIDSYNFMLDKGLNLAVHDLSPVEVIRVSFLTSAESVAFRTRLR